MNLRDLVKKFFEGRAPGLWSESDKDIEGMRAVVRALRDEFVMMGMRDFSSDFDIKKSRAWFNEILGDAGSEKVAGGSAREDEKAVEAVGDKGPVSVNSPATDHAPAVCEWTQRPNKKWRRGCCGGEGWRYAFKDCPCCKAPIKFTEAK